MLTGLLEIARAAGTGLVVDLDAIPLLPEGRTLCREFGLDPLGTLASGALLLTVEDQATGRLAETLAAAGYPSAVIGRVTPPDGGLVALRAGERVPWPEFAADEVTAIFAQPAPRKA